MTTILIYNTTRAHEYREFLLPQLPQADLIACTNPQEAAAVIDRVDVLFTNAFPPELFAQAHRLRWIQTMTAGVEGLLAAPVPQGAVMSRVVGLFSDYMSEYAFAHLLADVHQISRARANQAASRWEPFQVGKLAGRRLGVAGAGSIGEAIARKGKAFGMEVWALVRTPRPMEGVDRLFSADGAQEFTAGVDCLVSSLPLTADTVGLIDPRQMKPGAILVNVGRGKTIDEDALLYAVRTNGLRAVLDAFTHEPLPAEHPFWTTPGITVTPHISGPSVPEEVSDYFVANFRRWQAGEPLVGLIAPERGY